MKNSKPKLGFRITSVTEKLDICGRFVRAAKELPEPQRTAAQADAMSERLDRATAAVDHVETLRAELRAAVTVRNAELVGLCRSVTAGMLGYSVTVQTAAELVGAGLRLEKAPLPVGKPGVPEQLRAHPGAQEGSVQLHYRRPVRRCVFVIERATGEGGPTHWLPALTVCTTRPAIGELVSGELYWFRVAALNRHGQSAWSQPVPVRAG
jgi:hypothetical protein